jgi:hypothetical protein
MTAKDGKPCTTCGTSEWNQWGSCKECKRRKAKEWRENNPERKKETDRRWQREHKDVVNAKNKKWREAHHEQSLETVRVSARKWRKNNPEKQRKACQRWNREHSENCCAYENRRRTRKRGSGGEYTAQQWTDLCNQYGNRCLCCGRTNVRLTADHVVPLSAGGSNTIENIQPLCKSCNCKKYTKTIDYRKGG